MMEINISDSSQNHQIANLRPHVRGASGMPVLPWDQSTSMFPLVTAPLPLAIILSINVVSSLVNVSRI